MLLKMQSASLQAEAAESRQEAECSVQQLKALLATHEEDLRVAQQAAQEAQLAVTMTQAAAQRKQAELHAAHSQELMRLHETHSADLRRLSAIQAEASQISHLLESSSELSRHPQELSPEEIGGPAATSRKTYAINYLLMQPVVLCTVTMPPVCAYIQPTVHSEYCSTAMQLDADCYLPTKWDATHQQLCTPYHAYA